MPDFWLPLTAELLIDGETARLKRPNANFLDLIGRVRPGVNPKTLEAKLKVEFHDWLASHVPDMGPGEKQLWRQQTLHLIPGGAGVEVMRDQYEDGLKLLLIAAGCVLLVACANLANLMLARGLKDRAQTSIRVALGASRGRLVRGVLVESMLLAIIGGLLGIAVAYAGTKLIVSLAFQIGGPNNYVPLQAAPSWPILLFTLVISMLTGVLFGIAPAWMTSHADPADALRGAGRSVGSRTLLGTKVAGHRSDRSIGGFVVRGRSSRQEPAKPGTSELRIRNEGPLHRLDQSDAGQLQTWSNWSRCSGISTTAFSRFPACEWWRLRSMRP